MNEYSWLILFEDRIVASKLIELVQSKKATGISYGL